MKILIVSWYFPPANTMGALRVGKLAKYLFANGHDVRVLCGRDLPFGQSLPREVPADAVHDTRWLDVNALPRSLARLKSSRGGDSARARTGATTPLEGFSTSAAGEGRSAGGVLRRLSQLYVQLFNRPDPQIGWYPFAYAEGCRILRRWSPDVVFASAPPFTTLLVARRLARKFSLPLVTEFRDRWYEDSYTDRPRLEIALEKWWEDRVLQQSRAIVTVSEPWGEDYRRRTGKPVAVVYNGFDPDDFPASGRAPDGEHDRLNIVYTGIIYPGRRDPTPLFRALRLLGPAASSVRVRFYGATPHLVAQCVAATGVEANVENHGPVPYRHALEVQSTADVVLLMQWNDPREKGNCPGKLFEYIASRRPTLALGLPDGVPATILRERDAGLLLNDPAAIAAQLKIWLEEKRTKGSIPLLPLAARQGLSRPDQFRKLELFLDEIVANRPCTGRARELSSVGA